MSERESQQHEWTFFRQHSSGNTTDAYDYCRRCGAIRARYFWKDKDGGVSHQADSQYFGVGIEDHTTNQPLCLALLAPEPEPSDARQINDVGPQPSDFSRAEIGMLRHLAAGERLPSWLRPSNKGGRK